MLSEDHFVVPQEKIDVIFIYQLRKTTFDLELIHYATL